MPTGGITLRHCCGPEGRENKSIKPRADMGTTGGWVHVDVCVCLSFHTSICMHYEDIMDGFNVKELHMQRPSGQKKTVTLENGKQFIITEVQGEEQ